MITMSSRKFDAYEFYGNSVTEYIRGLIENSDDDWPHLAMTIKTMEHEGQLYGECIKRDGIEKEYWII